jgi:hypothetical protein
MATTPIDFSSVGGVPVKQGPIDFSSIGGVPVQTDPIAMQTKAVAQAAGGSTGPAPLPTSMQPAKETYDNSGSPTQIPQNIQDEIVRQGNRQASLGTAQAHAAQSATPVSNAAFGLEAPEALAKMGEGLESILPSSKMAEAGQKFNQLRGEIGGHTVAMTDRLGSALEDIKSAVDTGTTLPTVVNKFVTRIADMDQAPLTYEEARNFYHNVSDLAASDRMAMNKNAQRLVLQFKSALGDAVASTADKAGQLQKYQDAMRGFASGAQTQERINQVKDLAVKYGGPAILGGGVYQGIKELMNLRGGH